MIFVARGTFYVSPTIPQAEVDSELQIALFDRDRLFWVNLHFRRQASPRVPTFTRLTACTARYRVFQPWRWISRVPLPAVVYPPEVITKPEVKYEWLHMNLSIDHRTVIGFIRSTRDIGAS
jgi:hypothetical protein